MKFNMDAHNEKLRQQFEKRQEARIAELQKKKENSAAKQPAGENAEAFTRLFTQEISKITEMLVNLDGGLSKPDLASKFDEMVVLLEQVQKYLTDSVMFLPSYEVRQAQENLRKLQYDVYQKRDEMIPRKKFAFKSRTKKGAGVQKTEKSEENKITLRQENTESIRNETDFGFTNQKNSELTLTADECRQKDIKLSNLEGCNIKIYGCPTALHVNNLKNCKILSGPVSRASFVSDCVDCQFSLACQQLRIHTTTKTVFNIHVTGKAIIEDCSQVGFAPYNWNYPGLCDNFQEASLNREINKWDEIDDFNWLKVDEQSPNWFKVPQEDRIEITET